LKNGCTERQLPRMELKTGVGKRKMPARSELPGISLQ
jgi:hypothetical protein